MPFEPFHRAAAEPFRPFEWPENRAAEARVRAAAAGSVLEPARHPINVMYHYVRPAGAATGSVPLTPEAFERQLDLLTEAFGPRDFRLTFDDGTRDHYDVVFPILRARGLTALFGVLSGPAAGEPMPNVHLVHYLLATVAPDEILCRLIQHFGEAQLGAPADAAKTYPRDAAARARTKFALNFHLSHDDARGFLLEQAKNSGPSIRRLTRDAYITAEQIQEMAEAGMQFAVHGHLHRPLALPASRDRAALAARAAAYYDEEIEPCERWLADLLGFRPTEYIVPFGAAGTCSAARAALADVLRERGYACGYLTRTPEPDEDPFWHGRIDCADLPSSAAELLALI
jgi:peptidoglycan/xylan/chitin deacetylase (PgdA/CDA1 family)